MASSEPNEYNSQLSSSIDKSMSRKQFFEHEESVKIEQMASKKLSNSSDGKEQIEDMDEKELKNLLDEAITYKNPRDANDKSDTFKRLLQNVTDEDERKRKFESHSLQSWKLPQSNSLQNLLDESHYPSQAHSSHASSSKKQRRKNSTSVSTRRLEGGSLPVDMHHSSCAIQSPPDQPFLSELKNNKKRKEKQLQQQQQAKETVIDIIDNETVDERKSYQRCLDSKDIPLSSSSYHDAIEMKSFCSRNSDHLHEVGGDSKFTTANTAPNTITTMASMMSSPIPTTMNTSKSSMSTMTSVDSSIPYTMLCEKPTSYQQAQSIDTINYPGSTVNHSNNILLAGGNSPNYGATASGGNNKSTDQVLQLPAGPGISSVLDKQTVFNYSANKRQQSRDDTMHHGSLMPTTTPQMSLNVNAPSTAAGGGGGGNQKDSKAAKKRAAKSERNEKTIDVQSIEGFCGHETVEHLLSYIDGGKNTNNSNNNQKNHNNPKNGLLASSNNNNNQAQLLNSEEKKKKMVAKNKEKVNKLKKSNSMDELCSTGRQEEQKSSSAANKTVQDSSSEAVTLRSKSSNLTNPANKKAGEKDGKIHQHQQQQQQQQPKRNERRSWGTEGLWPESSEILSNSNNTTNYNTIAANNIPNNINNNNHNNSSSVNDEQEQQENENSSSDSSSGAQVDIQENSVNISHLESISALNDAEKFQLVSKKRKVKRKSNEAPELKSSLSGMNHNNLYSARRVVSSSGEAGRNDFRMSGTKSTHSNDSNRNSAEKHSKKPLMSHDAKQTAAVVATRSGKNRRKSTSSMPPEEEGEEEGEYSDGGDSVQSLPIETTKTTSSLLSAPVPAANNVTNPSNNPPLPPPTTLTSAESKVVYTKKNAIVHQQFQPSVQQPVQQQQLQKSTTISYADIAKTSNRSQNNQGNNIIAAASTEKWPSISSSSSSHHQNNNNSNSTDPFAISNFDAMSNNNSSSSKQQPKVTTAAVVSSTNSISTSTISFPDLVESNNSRNKQLSNNSDMTTATSATLNGDATQTELKSLSLNGGVSGMVFMDSIHGFIVDPDRINNNSQKISYSQSLLEQQRRGGGGVVEHVDANGNAQFVNNNAVITTTPSVNKNVLMKSKSVDHNNLSSIEHYPALEKTKQKLSEVLSKPIETLVTKKQQKQVKNATTTTTERPLAQTMTVVDDGKIICGKKKDKLTLKNVATSTSPQSTQQKQQQQLPQPTSNINNNINNTFGSHHRPAVIILNDNDSFDNTTAELGITFGFDIDEHLLCGHPNGDASSSVVMADDIESSASNNANNNNCDIMNTNLSSNNLSNNNQSIDMYENYMVVGNAAVSNAGAMMILPHTHTIQSTSSPENITMCSANITMDSSHDLGYLSSSNHSPPAAANSNIINNQKPTSENDNNHPHERDFSLQVTPKEIRQHTKFEEFKMPPLPNFISPSESKNFNFEELVAFVSEEWTKAKRNGIFFNDQ